MKLPLPDLLRLFLRDFAVVTAINIVIAVIITYEMRIGGSFLVNLVFSICIGSLACLFIGGSRLLLWGIDKPPKFQFFLLWIVAIPSAKFLGHKLATYILGLPAEVVDAVQNQHATSLFTLTVLACTFLTIFFWNRGKLEKLQAQAEAEKARAASIEKQAMQAQLQLLQAQIEPHMLFNTLANLQGLISVNAPRAQHMLDQLILYLRATLSSSRAEKTTLSHEFSLMEAYLGLMSVRMGKRLSFTLQLPHALEDVLIPPMLLQPLIENAIKHGLEPKIDGGHIDVRATLEQGMLRLSIADTGLGLGVSPARGTQVGLANVRERLLALYGTSASLLLLANPPDGTIAQLDLPS